MARRKDVFKANRSCQWLLAIAYAESHIKHYITDIAMLFTFDPHFHYFACNPISALWILNFTLSNRSNVTLHLPLKNSCVIWINNFNVNSTFVKNYGGFQSSVLLFSIQIFLVEYFQINGSINLNNLMMINFITMNSAFFILPAFLVHNL